MNDWTAPAPGNIPPLPPRYDGPTAPAQQPVAPAAPVPVPHRAGESPQFVTAPQAPVAPHVASPRDGRPGAGRVFAAAMLAAVVGAVAALGGAWGLGAFDKPTPTTVVKEQAQPAASPGPTFKGTDVVGIAERVRPAIVNIQVAGSKGQGSGSGVIFDDKGLIMTNNHVVEGAQKMQVQTTDGKTLQATLVGTDPETDIAVVKVDSGGLSAATLGSATQLQIGQPTVAIGNPLGLEGGPSVSEGIVSALGREVRTDNSVLVDMIQTDAAISPGSSGGALLDADGNVIGITTAIGVSDAGAEGIGFATPIDVAHKVANDIVDHGKADHPFLGIRGVDAANSGGAQVVDVTSGSPASQAGLQKDDIVTAVDGDTVKTMSGLKVKLRTYDPGTQVNLSVNRGGTTKDVIVTLGKD